MSLLGELSYALIQPSARAIGQIYADVTVEENHRDESVITRHPVEGGATIGDHAFDLPPLVEIRGGFSNSTAGYVGYVQEQYQALLALKASKRPFALYTGKRRYQDMLIAGISVITDPRTENVLMFTAVCQHITIVRTQTSRGGNGTDAAPASDPSNQADPASTGSVTNAGNVEAQGVGSQAFAGAYGPGSSLNPGSGVASSAIGDTSFGAVGESLSGLSPAAPVSGFDAGEITFSDPATGEVLGTTPPYNPFATGAFGGT